MSRLDRWSRLKRGESLEAPPSPVASGPAEPEREPAGPDARDTEHEPSSPPEPGSLDHTLPDPDTLPPGSDIKAYMVSGVSAGLRKRALRRLFAANHYGLRDGLDDYDDDYRERLKPLANEVAERLRQWTRRQAEGDDEAADDVTSEGMATHERDAREISPDAPERASDTADASEADADERPG